MTTLIGVHVLADLLSEPPDARAWAVLLELANHPIAHAGDGEPSGAGTPPPTPEYDTTRVLVYQTSTE